MTQAAKPQLKKSVVIKRVDDDCVVAVNLLSEDADDFIRFEGPASQFLQGMVDGHSVKQIVSAVVNRYAGAKSKVVENDYISFIKEMRKLDLLK